MSSNKENKENKPINAEQSYIDISGKLLETERELYIAEREIEKLKKDGEQDALHNTEPAIAVRDCRLRQKWAGKIIKTVKFAGG